MQYFYQQPIARMLNFFTAAYHKNPDTMLEVFVHKAESLAVDYKIGTCSRPLHLQAMLDISNFISSSLINLYISSSVSSTNYLTSRQSTSTSHSTQLSPYLSNLQVSNTFLFDVKLRLYVATDWSPIHASMHNLCSDYVQTLSAFGPLYM
ncbi:hypothetical protein EI94DRAFT_1577487 [Lactarius quietus]|nr:hypothetical protein EI94DRAFT_1577487 [Lactarius quietus]